MYYNITFKYSKSTYCCNIAIGTEEQIKHHYAEYEIITLEKASDYDIKTAKIKGMPIIDCSK